MSYEGINVQKVSLNSGKFKNTFYWPDFARIFGHFMTFALLQYIKSLN